MMARLPEVPVIPPQLEQYCDDRILETQAALARMPFSVFVAGMPEVERAENAASFVDLAPTEDHDRKSAVVLPLPYANGWEPYMAYRAAMLRDSLDEPIRVVVFPNSTLKLEAYDLSDEERAKVAGGSFQPLAEKQFRALESLGIEQFHMVGYSQGASVGAAALRLAVETGDFGVKPSGLFEWPNGEKRSRKELSKDFMAVSLGSLNNAINETAIPGYSKSQQSRGGLDLPRQLARLTRYYLGTKLLEDNKALHTGLAQDTFNDDVEAALEGDPDLKLLLAWTENGQMTRVAAQLAVLGLSIKRPSQLRTEEIRDYGHELGDNLIAHTILGKMAITAKAFH